MDNIHLHAAVGHRHGIVGQGVTGHLAVIGAADGGERAHMAAVERVSPVRSAEVTTGRKQIMTDARANKWVTLHRTL